MPIWWAGIVAGIIAGMAMGMMAMMLMPMERHGVWYPVKLMAGTFEGRAVLHGGAGTILLGLMIHMMMSASLGLLFSLVMAGLGWHGVFLLIVAGIVYALAVFAVNWSISLPLVDPVMRKGMDGMVFAMTHVVYGLVLGGLLGVFR